MAQAFKGVFTTQLRRIYQGSPRFFCNFNRSTQELTKYVQSTDFLLTNLKNANSTKAVLEMVAQHNGIMNNKHTIQALRSLFTLQKNGNSELSTREILANREFRKLCRKLRQQAGGIELNDTIEALKVVSYVGVPADSTIFQVLLQLIRHDINHLNMQQIIFLDFLLSHAASSPLVDALKIALPIIFEIHLPVKMDYTSPIHLAECLYFASRNRVSMETVKRIVDALGKHDEFDVKTAKSVVWSVCEMESDEVFRALMGRAIDSLVVHLDELNFNEMETTLTKLIGRYNRKYDYFYNETFYDSCANYVIDKDLGYKNAIYLLRKLGRVNFFHKFLLDYMSQKVHDDPSVLANSDALDIYSIVVAISLTDYRPVHWETLKNLIVKSSNVSNSERKEIIWIKFASALCLLDIYKLDVLNKCLDETFLYYLFNNKKKFMSDFENYATIWQGIKLYKPEFNCLLNSKFEPETVSRHYRQDLEFPLETALHKALGGESYVTTGLYSKYGIQIDHAVVFRKGGYPVAMNSAESTEFIEDIEVSSDNQMVAILGLRHYNYTLNSRRPKCSTIQNIKVLESLGYQVVPVCLEVWENLPDFEKIPYLMRTIKERIDSDLKVSESVI